MPLQLVNYQLLNQQHDIFQYEIIKIWINHNMCKFDFKLTYIIYPTFNHGLKIRINFT
jgi:hypothetical protein